MLTIKFTTSEPKLPETGKPCILIRDNVFYERFLQDNHVFYRMFYPYNGGKQNGYIENRDIKPTDRIYVFNDETQIAEELANRRCLDRFKFNFLGEREPKIPKILGLLAEGYYVGGISNVKNSLMEIGSRRRLLRNSSSSVNSYDSAGKNDCHHIGNEEGKSIHWFKEGEFVYTKDEYEFFHWLNTSE